MIRIKKLVQLAFVFLLVFLSSYTHRKNDLSREHLMGKVKSIEELYHPVVNDTLGIKAFYAYNEDGNLVEKKVYSQNSLLYNILLVYTDKGKLTERNTYNADSLQEKIKYNLADNGNILESIDYNLLSHSVIKFEYHYDNNGNPIEIDGWNSADSLKKIDTLKNLYQYDGKGNVIEEKHFDINGVPTYMQSLIYNDSNHIISAAVYAKASNPENQKLVYSYDFDKTNNWVKQRIFSNDTLVGTKTRVIEYY